MGFGQAGVQGLSGIKDIKGWTIWGLISAEGRGFNLLQNAQTCCVAYSAYLVGTRVTLQG
jgi:hypothetical protein